MDRLGAIQMYKAFAAENPDTDVTYTLYKHTLSKFFKKVTERILEGETFYMGNKLGSIRIKRVERAPNSRTIDWYETNKLKAEGINMHVYFTDEFWYRWYWDRGGNAPLKNKSVYKFSPTEGSNGNKKALVKKLKTDEFAHLNYKA